MARLSSVTNSKFLKRGGRIFGLGSAISMTAIGITIKMQDQCMSALVKEDKGNSLNLAKSPFYLKRMVHSLLGLEQINAEEVKMIDKVHHSTVSPLMKTNSYTPTGHWDNNWDKRDPESLVKPLKANASEEELEAYQNQIQNVTPSAKRTYILVRHGQYEMKDTDEDRILTQLGRKQANATGERLYSLWQHLLNKGTPGELDLTVTMSTMTRATETAQIILQHFSNTENNSCDLIREGAPCEPVPTSKVWNPDPHEFFEEGARIEAGFRKYIHRADASQDKNSVNILVCHGNVIRYFVCRALQLSPEAWLRFSVHNASITTITVQPSGRVNVSGLGESGHLPPDMLTFN